MAGVPVNGRDHITRQKTKPKSRRGLVALLTRLHFLAMHILPKPISPHVNPWEANENCMQGIGIVKLFIVYYV
jgi:hypothetical protein